VFVPVVTPPAGKFKVSCRVWNPPPMPPKAAPFPSNVTLPVLIGNHPDLFTCTLASVSYFRLWIRIQSCSDPLTFVPGGITNEAVDVVPPGAVTSIGNVIVVEAAAGEAVNAKLAVPRIACVEELVAVTVIVVCAATVLGAVYKPAAVMLPVAGLTAQATLVPEGKF